jgi:hypothetical protein
MKIISPDLQILAGQFAYDTWRANLVMISQFHEYVLQVAFNQKNEFTFYD